MVTVFSPWSLLESLIDFIDKPKLCTRMLNWPRTHPHQALSSTFCLTRLATQPPPGTPQSSTTPTISTPRSWAARLHKVVGELDLQGHDGKNRAPQIFPLANTFSAPMVVASVRATQHHINSLRWPLQCNCCGSNFAVYGQAFASIVKQKQSQHDCKHCMSAQCNIRRWAGDHQGTTRSVLNKPCPCNRFAWSCNLISELCPRTYGCIRLQSAHAHFCLVDSSVVVKVASTIWQ